MSHLWRSTSLQHSKAPAPMWERRGTAKASDHTTLLDAALLDASLCGHPVDEIAAVGPLLVAALVPGIERQPLKKFDAHEETLLKLLHRLRREADQAGRNIRRIVVAARDRAGLQVQDHE
jgi:hypothetical protein